MHTQVVHIEGMDLAGKSTATGFVVSATGGSLMRNSLVPDNPIYLDADEHRRNGAPAAMLAPMYVEALAWDLDHLLTDSNRVQDSTILLRSLAVNDVLGYADIVREFVDMIPRHPMFGATIVLTASIDARLLRLEERQRLAPEEVAPDDLMVVTQAELFMEMERALVGSAHRHFNAVEIDTSSMSKIEVQTSVTALLRGMGSAGAWS